MKCISCQVIIQSEEDQKLHYKTQWHRYNVKRKIAEMKPIKKSLFDARLILLAQNENEMSKCQNMIYKCRVCGKKFKSEETLKTHLQTKKHADRLKEQTNLKNKNIIFSKRNQTSREIKFTIQSLFHPIPLKHCLFCPQKFKTLTNSLNHMVDNHNFWIPFIEYCTVKTLLIYLGRLLGERAVCPFCFRQYTTIQGLWDHMKVKKHCRVFLSEYDSEIEEHYNFSGEKTIKYSVDNLWDLIEQKLTLTKSPILFNEFNEIILCNGSFIGHRQLKQNYRQPKFMINKRNLKFQCKVLNKFKDISYKEQKDSERQNNTYSKRMLKFQMRYEKIANNQKHFKNMSIHF